MEHSEYPKPIEISEGRLRQVAGRICWAVAEFGVSLTGFGYAEFSVAKAEAEAQQQSPGQTE